MITVTTHDHKTGDIEEGRLDKVSHILVVNEDAGFYLAGEQRYSNGTTILTIKRRSITIDHQGEQQ